VFLWQYSKVNEQEGVVIHHSAYHYGGTLLVAQLVEALRYKSEGRGFDS
jgi:hypothetical protein